MENTRFVCRFFVVLLIINASLAGPVKSGSDAKKSQPRQRKCGVKDLTSIHPELSRKTPKDFTSHVVKHLKQNSRLKGDKEAIKPLLVTSFMCDEVYIIPVIVHVLAGSSGEGDVPDARVRSQIDVMNRAYKKTPFQFKLLSIRHIVNDNWVYGCVVRASEYMQQLAVTPATVMNVYTCSFQGYDMLGNAAYPWWYPENSPYHGVVIHPETLPGGSMTRFNLGHNMVHEVGHYFGLFHVFENGCEEPGDYVEDTPPMGYPIFSCPNDDKTCPQNTVIPTVDNYMGYADDECMDKFTPLQNKRMLAMVDKYRPKLLHTVYRPCIIDAVFRWSNEYLYFFSQGHYYRYNQSHFGIDEEYPIKIGDFWKGVPSDIDGVFRYANGITYFFKGDKYLRFNDTTQQVDPGYPKLISSFWKGVPNNIDAVISYSNGYTYFFKGSLYYRFNHTTASVDPGYPKQISEYWTGVPNNIEAAFTWFNGGVYFYKDAQFWLFEPREKITVSPRYPRPMHYWWQESVKLSGYSAFRHCNGYTYFFDSVKYWRYDDFNQHVDYLYPKSMTLWKEVPQNVDGVFTWSNGYAYFFKGDKYYRMNFTSGQVDKTTMISSFWKGVPNDIDAVFRYTNGITYFFKDSYYYRFNDTSLQVDAEYPKYISSFWKGIPNGIDTAFVWSNGLTYFFKGNQYYRFNCTTSQVDEGYPQPIGNWRGVLYNP